MSEHLDRVREWWHKRKHSDHAWCYNFKAELARAQAEAKKDPARAEAILNAVYNLDRKHPESQDELEHLPPKQLIDDILREEGRMFKTLSEIRPALEHTSISTKDGWCPVPLKELLSESSEQVHIEPEQEYTQVTVKLWGKGVVQRNQVKGKEIKARKRFIVRTNQFIMSRIDARNGAFGLVPPSLDGAVVSGDFPSFIINDARVLPKFISWLSKTPSFIEICTKASEGSTNRVRLKVDRFLQIPIELPSLSEQERIIGLLSEIETVMEAQQLVWTQLEALLSSVMHQSFYRDYDSTG